MAQYDFKGDIDSITDRQLEFIKNVIVELGFENSNVTFEPVGKAGDNYIAGIKRIRIEGEKGSLTLIAKIAHSAEFIRQMTQTSVLFRNEHIIYTELFPKFVQLQKDADIPIEEQLRYAKCYGSLTEQPHEVIILEDLQNSDFKLLDRFDSLSSNCVKLVLRNFAVLHALSYVLRLKEPETFENFKNNLIGSFTLMAETEIMKKYLKELEDDTLSLFEDAEHINCIRHKVTDAANLAIKLMKADHSSQYTVIQQGDAWANNILFRFEDDIVKESIMIDYQLSKNGSPVYDILYMIFNCTDCESRRQNFYKWIDYYHSELDKFLSNFNLKANYVYPRDKLDADLKRYGKLMFGVSIMMANVSVRKSEDTAKMMEAIKNENIFEDAEKFGISKFDEESKTLYRNKIIGFIDSFTEFGLL